MANLDSENLKFMPVVKKKGNIYIDPPAISDAISTRFNKAHVTVTDLDKLAHRGGILQKLGCAIYQAKTNFVQENVYLTSLPQGYYIRRDTSQSSYIVGHPSGHKFSAETFVPHFLWLENCWQLKNLPRKSRSTCACDLCPLPVFRPTISFEINHCCTIDTFKELDKIEIRHPEEEFHPKPFTIPLPSINEPDISTLLSTNDD